VDPRGSESSVIRGEVARWTRVATLPPKPRITL